MDTKIAVPTDNIYKFLATFGLVVMVASMTMMILNTSTTNKTVWEAANAIYDLEVSNDPLKDKRMKLLESEIRVAASNRTFGLWSLAIIFSLGLLASFEGFRRWYKYIQPIYDEILELEREKLRLEVNILKK
jgi:hypothetical protein